MLHIRLGVYIGERAYDRKINKKELHVGTKKEMTIIVECKPEATLVVHSRSNLRERELRDTGHRSPSTFVSLTETELRPARS